MRGRRYPEHRLTNMIPAKVKGCNQRGRPCTARLNRSKLCETSTQRRNPLNNLPVPFRCHFWNSPNVT